MTCNKSDGNLEKILWSTRRGMLELDLLLEPFARQVYTTLDEMQQKKFRELLSCQDVELSNWLLYKYDSPPKHLVEIVGLVINAF